MAPPSRRVDRRMQRTRQVLQQAFIEVAHEKGIVATTVQDITELFISTLRINMRSSRRLSMSIFNTF